MTEGPSGEPSPGGHLRPTGAATVGGSVIAGLVTGWLLHPVTDRIGNPPVVTWLPAAALFFVAAILGGVAFLTHRTLHVRRQWLEPQQAVNRLLLARACVVAGALVAGGYFGYAVSWLGVRAELADERLVRSVVAGVAALLVVVTALLLERACRVRSDDEEP